MLRAKKESIIIVGGGPAGLAIAAHLLDNGVSCRILERRSRKALLADTNSFYDMASSGIQALLRIAQGAAAPAIFDAAIAYEKIAMFNGGNETPLVNIEWKSRSLGMPMFHITRTELLTALLETVEKLDPNSIHFETNARLLDPLIGTVEVEGPSWGGSDKKQVLMAELVVAADGVHSRLRKKAFGDTGLRSDGIVACYAVLPPLTPAEAKSFPKPEGMDDNFAICGMEADFFQYAVVGTAATFWYANFILDGKPYIGLPTDPVGPNGWLGEARERCKGRYIPAMETMMARTKEENVQVVACYDREPLETYSCGKLVLIGDAAHPFTPYAGLGASQAMVDAFCLAEALLGSRNNVQAAVKKYEELRLKPANANMEESRKICSTSWALWLLMQIVWIIFWFANLIGKAEWVCDTFMTIDGNSMVNELVPLKNEKEKQLYQQHYDAAISSLKSQLKTKSA